jgi:5'-3' exonuclease
MGVPGLFANLKNKYPKIIKKCLTDVNNSLDDILQENIILNPNVLFFDFNCIIHPINHLLWKIYSHLHIKDFEHKVMVETIKYTEKIIQYANVNNFAYIFIDGVCPYSKMVQQRQRRLASIMDKQLINNLRQKNGLSVEEYYDTNSITPGTEFMENFNQHIIKFVQKWNECESNKVKIKYSSYHEPGEGEHKIINYIKENADTLKDQQIVIYGLDADLIILSLTLAKDFNIKLLRENNEVSLETMDMIVFDVNECAKAIIHELSNYTICDNYFNNDNYKYVDDFIFVTTLLGNDFIPSNPTVNMKFRNRHVNAVNGYELLIDMYKETKKDYENCFLTNWLNNRLTINWRMFKELINKLATFEQQYFESVRNRYNNTQNKTGFELELDMMNLLAFKIEDPLKMYAKYLNYQNQRKKRFIHHYFGGEVCECIGKNNKKYGSQLYTDGKIYDNFYDNKVLTINENKYDEVIKKYLITIGYVMYYYYTGCPNNMYYYKYCNGILMSDLYEYINKNIDQLDNLFDCFLTKVNKKILPIQQLLIVLPEKSFNLIPNSVKRIFEDNYKSNNENTNLLIKFYKTVYLKNIEQIKRDFLNKSKLYQATLITKIPKLHLINALLANIFVLDDELKRII